MKTPYFQYTMKGLLVLAFATIIVLGNVTAQESRKDKEAQKEAKIKDIVSSKNYVFEPAYALPMRGGSRILSSGFHMKINGDTINTYLPYFGRAYSAPANLEGGGIEFKSVKFEYTVNETKRGWDILIKPKDAIDVQQITLTISSNGSASLQVISNNREAISFEGDIRKGK